MKQIKHFQLLQYLKFLNEKIFCLGILSNVQKLSISCTDCIIDGFEYFCRTRNCITSAGNSKMPLTTSNKFQAMLWLTRKLNYINK